MYRPRHSHQNVAMGDVRTQVLFELVIIGGSGGCPKVFCSTCEHMHRHVVPPAETLTNLNLPVGESCLQPPSCRVPRPPTTSRNGPGNSYIRYCEFEPRTGFPRTRDQVLSRTTSYAWQCSKEWPILARIPNKPNSKQCESVLPPSLAEDSFLRRPRQVSEDAVCGRVVFPNAIAVHRMKSVTNLGPPPRRSRLNPGESWDASVREITVLFEAAPVDEPNGERRKRTAGFRSRYIFSPKTIRSWKFP